MSARILHMIKIMPGHRRSIRLKGYDYAREGAYYVTVCADDHKCILGDVRDGKMVLNAAGEMINKWWRELPRKYNLIEIDEYKIMPNHLHGIIVLVNEYHVIDRDMDKNNINGQTRGSAPTPTVGTIIQWFKTMSSNEYIRNVKSNNWTPFNTRLWQRNYYEHIIRNDSDLARIRGYIINNPLNWEKDENFNA